MIVNQLKEISNEVLNSDEFIYALLIGSYSRGDFEKDSDLDVLLVIRNLPTYPDQLVFNDVITKLGYNVDLILMSQIEFKKRVRRNDPFILHCLTEGIEIFGSKPKTKDFDFAVVDPEYIKRTIVRYNFYKMHYEPFDFTLLKILYQTFRSLAIFDSIQNLTPGFNSQSEMQFLKRVNATPEEIKLIRKLKKIDKHENQSFNELMFNRDLLENFISNLILKVNIDF